VLGTSVASDFSPISLMGGGHNKLIRESFPSPFSPDFWDEVAIPLNVGLCARPWASKRPNAIRLCGAGPETLTIGIRVSTAMPAWEAS
jgi:hypothetical protein